MPSTTSGILLIVIGLVAMLGAIFNWWIVTRSRRLFNMLFGDMVIPRRALYILL